MVVMLGIFCYYENKPTVQNCGNMIKHKTEQACNVFFAIFFQRLKKCITAKEDLEKDLYSKVRISIFLILYNCNMYFSYIFINSFSV